MPDLEVQIKTLTLQRIIIKVGAQLAPNMAKRQSLAGQVALHKQAILQRRSMEWEAA